MTNNAQMLFRQKKGFKDDLIIAKTVQKSVILKKVGSSLLVERSSLHFLQLKFPYTYVSRF